jgi:rubrerythrin
VEMDKWLRDPHSRRRFFAISGVSLGAGGAVFLGACGDDEESGSSSSSSSESEGSADVDILNSALELEYTAIAAYTAGAKLLKGDVLAAGEEFLAQEQEHADGLVTAIGDLGGTPVEPKMDDEYDFPKLSSQEDVLNFANELENTAIAAYVDAIPKLTEPELRVTAAQIVTNEAEHVSVLLGALGQPQVPDAFVTGTQA